MITKFSLAFNIIEESHYRVNLIKFEITDKIPLVNIYGIPVNRTEYIFEISSIYSLPFNLTGAFLIEKLVFPISVATVMIAKGGPETTLKEYFIIC